MKTIMKDITCLFILLIFFGFSENVNSQNIKLTREEKKEVRKARMEVNFYVMDSLLNSGQFVLEADYLQDKRGNRYPVNSNLNFIMLDGPTGVLQTGSDVVVGSNGIGGVTAEGTVNSWEMAKDTARYVFTIRFGLLTDLGYYNIMLRISTGNNATAEITGVGGVRLIWGGYLKTLESSLAFKGMKNH
jgi:hypothetical protein